MARWTFPVPQWEFSTNPATMEELLRQPGPGSPMALTANDLDMLEAFYKYRFLTTLQVGLLFYADRRDPRQQARRRLRILFGRGLLTRLRPPALPGQGALDYIWALAAPGYQILHELRLKAFPGGEEGPRWQETDNLVEMSRIHHEVELNQFGITVRAEAERRGIDFLWVPTRLAWQKVTLNQGGKLYSFTVSPDAIFCFNLNIVHVEYERSADPRKFVEKMARWRNYRNSGAWKQKFPRPPLILIAGYGEPGPVMGRSRKIRSITPLQAIAREQGMEGIFFLRHEDWQAGNWTCRTPRGEQSELFSLREEGIWGHVFN